MESKSPAVASQRPSPLKASDHAGPRDDLRRPEPPWVAQVGEPQLAVRRRGRNRPSVRRKRDGGTCRPGLTGMRAVRVSVRLSNTST